MAMEQPAKKRKRNDLQTENITNRDLELVTTEKRLLNRLENVCDSHV